MTNREKFAEKILNIACSGGRLAVNKATLEPIACSSLECRDCCLFYTECCKGARKKWANSEYVEPPIDWTKVPTDTPILVREYENRKWIKRYFAKYKNGKVFAWCGGATSWSSNDDEITPWKYAKLAESEGK